eukprot:COSAG05_NODE_2840_length_2582_cov_1.500201_1_plen_438_part_00
MTDVNGGVLPDVDLRKLPPLNRAQNKSIVHWTDTQIYQERIGRVVRSLNMIQKELGQTSLSIDADGDGIDDEEELEGVDDASAWADGRIVGRAFSGEMDEWSALGLSYQLVEHPQLPNSPQRTELNLFVHVERKFGFYMLKVLLPLYLLLLITFCNAGHPTDEVGSRLSFTVTGFLAAFAMLYIVGESLPKAERLTTIDQVITLTTVTICCLGMSSVYVYYIHNLKCPNEPNDIFTVAYNDSGHPATIIGPLVDHFCKEARDFDLAVTGVLALLNVIGNIHIFWRPVTNRIYDKHKLDKYAKTYAKELEKKRLTTAERIMRDMHAMEDKANSNTGSQTNPLMDNLRGSGSSNSSSEVGSDIEGQDRHRVSKRVMQAKENLRCLELLIEQDRTDNPLPTVNRFCVYVPWDSVETYADYLRRRLSGRRVEGAKLSRVLY